MAHSPKFLPDPSDRSSPGALPSADSRQKVEHDLGTLRGALGSAGQQEPTDLALDLILHDIAERAREATGATGAAIALRRGGEMVCRASAGTTAPDLGMKITMSFGLSGACVRTGETQWCTDTDADDRVDAEACRRLGVRSIIVVPLFSAESLAGVFEVFSPRRAAFGEGDLQTLQDLAQWVTEAIQGASIPPARHPVALPGPPLEEAAPTAERAIRPPKVSPWLPKPAAPADPGTRVLRSAVVVAAVLLCSLLAYRWGWQKAHSGPSLAPTSAAASTLSASPSDVRTAVTASVPPASLGQDQTPLQAKAGTGKPSPLLHPGSLVIYDKGSIIYRQSPGAGPPPPVSETEAQETSSAAGKAPKPATPADAQSGASSGAEKTRLPLDEKSSVAQNSQQLPSGNSSSGAAGPSSSMSAAMSPPPSLPPPSPVRVSEGIHGGQIVLRVEPKYPPQALLRHLEGEVVLRAHIARDGKIRAVKALRGQPELTQAAVDALRRWRYEPFTLNGQPVEMDTEVTIHFKLPR